MYIYDEENTNRKKVRILKLLSSLLYLFAVFVLILEGFLHKEFNPGWVIIPLSLFVVATFLEPLVTHRSRKSLAVFSASIYLCFTFVLGLFRPDLSAPIVATVNSVLGWVLFVTLFIGIILIAKRKIKRRGSNST